MDAHDERRTRLTRRAFLGSGARGLGSLALAQLLARDAFARPMEDAVHGHLPLPHHPPRARRVVFLCMAGGPSQYETFDNKPELARMDGEPMPSSFTAGQPIAQLQGQELRCLAPQFPFKRWGASGQEITTLFPHIGSIADRICIVRSMQTDQINHDPAHTVMNTGTSISGRPSMGSWVHYGLGSPSQDLPGFVVLTSRGGRNPQPIATRQWHSGFLPAHHQGVELFSHGDPVHYVSSPPGVDLPRQRQIVDAITTLDRIRDERVDSDDLRARIRQYELAFRMQASVPDLMDLSDEPEETLELYGTRGGDGSFAANCLLARRLLERGVRFVQLYHRGWDHHNGLRDFMQICANHTDRASAALITDLARRGLLEDTLVVWTGEFGRTPMAQIDKGAPGRDHHIRAFSLWLAGAGIRPGHTHGETDALGYHATRDAVHVHDLHATMLHLLGLDHQRLTYTYQGRDFRLTDVAGRVVHEILA